MESDTFCNICGDLCRINPSWHVMTVGSYLWITDRSDDEYVGAWRIPRRDVMHVEIQRGTWKIIIHTRFSGEKVVHSCGDHEHAIAMRHDIIGCLGWNN